jgi:hypothetical protein
MIKKLFLLIGCVALASTFLYGQNFRLGFQASPQLGWMKSGKSEVVNNGSRIGIDYGLVADLSFAEHPKYILNTGLLVSNQAFSSHFNYEKPFYINGYTFDNAVDIDFRMNYIQVPLDIKLKTDQFYRFTFWGQFGLTNYFNLSATANSSDNQLNDESVNSSMSFYYLGMLMGAGADYDLGGSTSVCFGIQYSDGLTDFTSIKNLNDKATFNSLKLVIGVMF